MQIEISIGNKGRSITIQADDNMVIGEVIGTLTDAGLADERLSAEDYLRTATDGRIISTHNTFRREKIYDGEELRPAEDRA